MNRLPFQLLYYVSWLLFFLICRAVFHVYHFDKSSEFTFIELINTFVYGLRLDASFAAYLSLLPFLVVTASFLRPAAFWRTIIKWYSWILAVAIALMQAADLELYNAWGYRLDATPLQYISSPTEVAATIASAPVLLLTVIWLVLGAFGIWLFRKVTSKYLSEIPERKLLALAGFFATALLILPLRGGWQQIPINQSFVYFSGKPYANHAAINMPWNVMHSLLRNDYESENPYQYLPAEEAAQRLAALHPKLPNAASILTPGQGKPNVLLIILESYTANYVGAITGDKGVTPNIDSLAKSGLLFNKVYSSGDRSEKGMASILSGYPAQPTTSVMKSPRKTEKLPYLSKEFKNAGYATSYYYGGELGFANLKSYLLNGGFDKFTDKASFDAKDYNSKWGVHDHVLLARVLTELNQEKQPFFSTVFTLSSHEPYEIPVKPKFAGKSEEIQFRNSVHYTDQAIGNFIRAAKKQPWWDNTLVILIADHGHRFPNDVPNHSPEKFHIPLIFTGGALQQTGVIEKVGSQTDLATILLKQINLPHDNFRFGKDLLNPQTSEHAFYVYNNGFGFVTQQGSFSFDNVSKAVTGKKGSVTEEDIKNGKAYMQQSFQDFAER